MYHTACSVAGKRGFRDSFLGPIGRQVNYVGHGVGLEIDEIPFLADGHRYPLKEGMTMALELKIVLDQGAVGLENTVAVTAGKPEKLTLAEETFILI